MSVYFALTDAHLSKIEDASKLRRFTCKEYYNVYGLKQENNPPVLVSYQELPEGKSEKEIKAMLKIYGIPVVFERLKYDTKRIGLRKDLREHIFLAGAVVNLLISYLEGKGDNKNYTLGMKRMSDKFLDKKIDFTKFVD